MRVAVLQSIMKLYLSPLLYLYLYIYKYKISFRHLLLLGKQLQHCNVQQTLSE